MKRLIIFILVFMMIISMKISVLAKYDISYDLPVSERYFITYNSQNMNYSIYYNTTKWSVYYSGNDLKLQNYINTTGYHSVWVRNYDNTESQYYGSWVNIINADICSGIQVKTVTNFSPYNEIIYYSESFDLTNRSDEITFSILDNVDLTDVDMAQLSSDTIINFDDSGIINGLLSLSDKLDVLLDNVSNNLKDIRDALYLQLDGIEIKFIDAFSELFTWLDQFVQIQITLTEHITTSLFNVHIKLDTMINQISTLPKDIATELDILLNPNNETLGGGFGEFASLSIESKVPIVGQVQGMFAQYSSTNSPILIQTTVTAGNMSVPIKIDFGWYEPYRQYIRTGVGGLLTMMMVLRAWAMISNVFGISVNSGIKGYMSDGGKADNSKGDDD